MHMLYMCMCMCMCMHMHMSCACACTYVSVTRNIYPHLTRETPRVRSTIPLIEPEEMAGGRQVKPVTGAVLLPLSERPRPSTSEEPPWARGSGL